MKIAVGLSGGVDSSVAALLLKEQGHEVVGITMKLWREGRYKGGERDACFGSGEAEDIAAAADFASAHGIEYRVFDCSEEYDQAIVRYFRETYLAGKTPNPCVRCNAIMKFGLLPDLARRSGLDFDKFATGHYSRTIPAADGSQRTKLLRAKDESKDQSYFLYRLSQEQLARHLFPLGELTKRQVREIARAHGLAAADKPDSQDFYSGDVAELIGAEPRRGEIVDLAGNVLAHHDGFWHFTIGQRKGLGIGGGGIPYYVVDVNACSNRVVVGRAEDAVRTSLSVADMNWVSISPTEEPLPVTVKVRSAGAPKGPAVLCGTRCTFPGGIAGVAPGQSAVFYSEDGSTLLCGGVIEPETR